MAISTLVLLALFSSVAQMTAGCGLVTHVEIGDRAIEYFVDNTGMVDFKELLLENKDAYQAGNPYPDSYWACRFGLISDLSDATHWSPFIETTIDYIRETKSRPWDSDTRKLVAFLLGVVGHQIMDVAWHSKDIEQAFLRTMTEVNYFGDYGKAHDYGDFGGDVLIGGEFDQEYTYKHLQVDNWYIPVQDLYEIYKRQYGYERVDADTIEWCASQIYLARIVEQTDTFARLYGFISKSSPFLVEEFEPFFLGGIDDMAAHTQTLMHKTIHMLEEGTSACDITFNPLFMTCPGLPSSSSSSSSYKGTVNQYKPSYDVDFYKVEVKLNGLTRDNLTITRGDTGVYFSPSPAVQAKLDSMNNKLEASRHHNRVSASVTHQPIGEMYVDNAYARFGRVMTTGLINGDMDQDLIVSAPGYGREGLAQLGRVYIVYGRAGVLDQGPLDLDQDADIILEGFEDGGRFGSALAALDLNMDGYTDLAISAPSIGQKDMSYRGEVYVFYGNQEGTFETVPDLTFTCTLKYCNFGWTMTSGDFDLDGNPDLMIGTPFAPANGVDQAGFVSILYAGTHIQELESSELNENDFDLTFSGEQAYGWFGHRAYMRTKPNLEPILLVSQPTYRACANADCSHSPDDIASAGALFMYGRATRLSTFQTTLRGEETFGKLGAAMALGDPFGNGSLVLAVSSDTATIKGSIAGFSTVLDLAGRVELYNVDLLSSTAMKKGRDPGSKDAPSPNNNLIILNKIATLEGDRRFGRFGAEVFFDDVTGDGIDDLVVGAPFRRQDLTDVPDDEAEDPLPSVEEGSVYVYKGGSLFDVGDVTNQCKPQTLVKPCTADKAYAELSIGEDVARFGSKMTVWKFNQKSHLLVNSPRSNKVNKLAGYVHVYSL